VKLWPRARVALVDGVISTSPEVFLKYKINTPLRIAHFMAQISHESDGGTITEENMNYTTAARIAAVWPSRFTPATAQAFVKNPKALANKVYNGRMGNQPLSDDGYNFRGRGLLQLTGRESYQHIGALTGLTLVSNPSLVNDPETALEVAACEFVNLKCLPACDADDIRKVTRLVNGGYIGIDSRRNWLAKWKLALPEFPGELPKTDTGTTEINDTHLPREADGDKANKGMATSTEGWAAIIATITTIATSAGQMISSIKPLISDPTTLAILAVIGTGACLYIWFRRRNRLITEHV
jgi:putative chitinase